MKGMKLWITTLVEYDEVGNATVLKSFVSPAKDSAAKSYKKQKIEKSAKKNVEAKEEELWD